MVTPVMKALLTELIDYAGLFPPAKLSMTEAIQNYFAYRDSPHGWILARFICPATRLGELASVLSSWEQELASRPLRLAITCSSAPTTDEFFSTLEREILAIKEFHELHQSRVHVELLECKMPQSLFSANAVTSTQVKSFLDDFIDFIDDELNWTLHPFLEPQFNEHWEKSLATLFSGFAQHYDSRSLWTRKHALPPGIKLRCGGTLLPQPPSPAQVAHVLVHGSNADMSFKATAGLHHPLPQVDVTRGLTEHGFLNVFIAAILAFTRSVSEDVLQALLTDSKIENFTFEDDTIRWKHHELHVKEITEARQKIISFGSCDFLEPIDELKRLQLA